MIPNYEFDELEPSASEIADARLIPTIALPRPDESVCADQVIRVISAHPNLFQREGQLCKIVRAKRAPAFLTSSSGIPRIRNITPIAVRSIISEHFRFSKEGQKGATLAECPSWLKQDIHERGEWEAIKPLTGVVTWPAMRPDGTFICKPGYDENMGLYYFGPAVTMPECPSEAEAREAAEFILDPVREFPFVHEAHRTAWFMLPLTLMARYAMDCTPIWIFDAPTPGTGKTLLAEIAIRMITGSTLPRMTMQDNDEEMEKRITTLVLSGETSCLIDNVVGSFGGAAFDSASTGTEWQTRMLGSLTKISMPIRIVWMVSGNNISIRGDMQRRVLHCRIDPGSERPEERVFKQTQTELMEYVDSQRAEFLRACMTVLRYSLACETPPMRPWGSFEMWTKHARKAAVLLGMPDPIATRDQFRKSADTTHEARSAFLTGLRRLLLLTERGAYTAKELVRTIKADEDTLDAACELAKVSKADQLTTSKLGWVLRQLKGRVMAGLQLNAVENRHAVMIWSVDQVDAVAEPAPVESDE